MDRVIECQIVFTVVTTSQVVMSVWSTVFSRPSLKINKEEFHDGLFMYAVVRVKIHKGK